MGHAGALISVVLPDTYADAKLDNLSSMRKIKLLAILAEMVVKLSYKSIL